MAMVCVKSVLAFGRNGASDWLWQRISAVILAAYIVFLFGYVLCHPQLDFITWKELFSGNAMRVFTLLALLSLVIHSWIGIWTVLTDYVKPFFLRLLLEIAVILALIAYLGFGVQILWSL
jgi:succinate dehydrogenase / fumarate reductase, membrane anchor subunit